MILLLVQLLSTALLVKSAPQLSSRQASPISALFRDEGGVAFHSTINARRRRDATTTVTASASWRTFETSPVFAIPRGGAIEQQLRGGASDGDDGVVVEKLRNVIRSVLKMTKESSIIHNSLLSLFKALESVTGVRLLPEKKKNKKKGSKAKKQKRVADAGKSAPVVEKKAESSKDKEKSATKQRKSESSKKPLSKSSATTTLQLKKQLKATNPNYRIQQELKAFLQDPPEHLSVATGKNIRIWIVTVEGIGIFKGETFRLRIQFPNNYPTVPPSVYFLPPNIPVHEHVYTNGDICLSLLGKDWRPTMTAQSVAHSILSILASAASKSLPMDNARHSQNKPGQYQADWVYHDDNC